MSTDPSVKCLSWMSGGTPGLTLHSLGELVVVVVFMNKRLLVI